MEEKNNLISIEELIEKLNILGQYLSKEHKDNYGQGICREAIEKIESLKKWINDLQSGMYVNCVYCGYCYGSKINTPVSMADILKEHIEKCPEHPMYQLKLTNEEFDKRHKELIQEIETLDNFIIENYPLVCTRRDKNGKIMETEELIT